MKPTRAQCWAKIADAAETLDLMVTHTAEGSLYGRLNGQAVPKAVAQSLQGDLFVKPSNDGLFPGMSQTWKSET